MNLSNNRGLTIIELVLAMSFSVVVIVILFAALRLGYKSQERGDAKAETMQKVRIISDRISWLIRGVYPFSVRKPDINKLYFEGRSDSIGFVTTSVEKYGTGPEDRAGLKWVRIHSAREGLKMTEKIFFSEEVFEDHGGKTYTLDPDVTRLSFEYYDISEDLKSGEWVSDWDTDDKKYLPAAVKVKITYEEKGQKTEMPDLIISIHTQKRLK